MPGWREGVDEIFQVLAGRLLNEEAYLIFALDFCGIFALASLNRC
jgi:hypothetical protein